jgi:hypothetical protein
MVLPVTTNRVTDSAKGYRWRKFKIPKDRLKKVKKEEL